MNTLKAKLSWLQDAHFTDLQGGNRGFRVLLVADDALGLVLAVPVEAAHLDRN